MCVYTYAYLYICIYAKTINPWMLKGLCQLCGWLFGLLSVEGGHVNQKAEACVDEKQLVRIFCNCRMSTRRLEDNLPQTLQALRTFCLKPYRPWGQFASNPTGLEDILPQTLQTMNSKSSPHAAPICIEVHVTALSLAITHYCNDLRKAVVLQWHPLCICRSHLVLAFANMQL